MEWLSKNTFSVIMSAISAMIAQAQGSAEHRAGGNMNNTTQFDVMVSAPTATKSIGGRRHNGANDPFPDGPYALLQPESHTCPTPEGWDSTVLKFSDKYILNPKDFGQQRGVFPLSNYDMFGSELVLFFCTRPRQHLGLGTVWPPGKYCIFQMNNTCPGGFTYGNISLPVPLMPMSNGPAQTNDYLTTFDYCCKNERAPKDQLKISTTEAFYLLPLDNNQCPDSTGMTNRLEVLIWSLNPDDITKMGLYPDLLVDINSRTVTMHFCYYMPYGHRQDNVATHDSGIKLTRSSTVEPETYDIKTPVVASVVSVLVFAIIFSVMVFCCRRLQASQSEDDVEKLRDNCFTNKGRIYCNEEIQTGECNGKPQIGCVLRSLLCEDLQTKLCPLLIDVNMVELREKIGQGAFGNVFRGEYSEWTLPTKSRVLAVKTLKDGCSFAEIIQFVEEAVTMAEFKHGHIMSIGGVCITRDTGVPMILMPFMKHGDLQSYLRKFRYDHELMSKVPSTLDLLGFGLQIAKGMEYLESLKFVHRDLATRNCMINEQLVVKIADFGLARDVYTNNFYKQDKHILLPVKWMAIECLQDRLFSIHSDVWAYGVTLWEILTLAKTPYPSLANSNILQYIQSGGRPEQPELCPIHAFDLLQHCWQVIPTDRPSFKQIVDRLDNYLSLQYGYHDFGYQIEDTEEPEEMYMCQESEHSVPLQPINESSL